MDLWQETHWFAVPAKPRRESFAADNINSLGIEVFLSEICKERSIRWCRRTITRPLFAGYLFARFSPRDVVESVRHARDVIAVPSTGRFPIRVVDTIVAGIRLRLSPDDDYVPISKPDLGRGMCVRTKEGPLEGWIGKMFIRTRASASGCVSACGGAVWSSLRWHEQGCCISSESGFHCTGRLSVAAGPMKATATPARRPSHFARRRAPVVAGGHCLGMPGAPEIARTRPVGGALA